ncbi:hypothetical protein PVAP13_1KG061400 [Panicum virgatum]|uniref:Uncharacterized protein n=1 Tax=Panicum virgatum TaxID=38727 RepID=A0A8T0XAF9_PANVG|nr:hypothetical protein PVAP13_1KG061400 [Panicum virgatum]
MTPPARILPAAAAFIGGRHVRRRLPQLGDPGALRLPPGRRRLLPGRVQGARQGVRHHILGRPLPHRLLLRRAPARLPPLRAAAGLPGPRQADAPGFPGDPPPPCPAPSLHLATQFRYSAGLLHLQRLPRPFLAPTAPSF